MVDVEKLELSVAHDFAILQENLNSPYENIKVLLEQQELKKIVSVSDPMLETCYVQCETDDGIEIKFTLPWHLRQEKGAKCRKALFLMDIGKSINPYLTHCFTHYKRLGALQWIDQVNNDLIILHIFEEGFAFAFHRMDRHEIMKYINNTMPLPQHSCI